MCGTRAATRLKSSSVEIDLRLVRDGQQVQHRVGRTAERVDDRDGVLERLLGQDLAGPDVALEQPHHRLARRRTRSRRDDGRRRAATRCRAGDMPSASADRRHGVGGEHAGARALASGRPCARSAQLLLGDRARRAGADRLEHRHDVERLALWCPGRIEPP